MSMRKEKLILKYIKMWGIMLWEVFVGGHATEILELLQGDCVILILCSFADMMSGYDASPI